MISYKILEDKFVNGNHYQLIERKDCVASDYSIVVPILEKDSMTWKFLVEWETEKFTKKLFDDLGNKSMSYLDFEKERPSDSNLTRYAEDNLQRAFNLGYCECEKKHEWHNIKENPTDLPNDGELVVADNGLAIDCVKFIKNEFGNSWKHDNFELHNVICWKN